MNGTRLSVGLPGASADAIVAAARLAESFNLDIWIGDPGGAGREPNTDDSYVLTAAAAAAAVTDHIRIGVFLGLNGSAEPLRVAEDVGVVDQASRGRLELGLVAPTAASDRESWVTSVLAVLRAWHDWPTTGGRSVAATPAPAQPWISRLVAGALPVASLADRLRGGVVVFEADVDSDATADDADSGRADRRTVLAVTRDVGARGIRGWLADDPLAAVLAIRSVVDRARAHEVLMLIPWINGSRLVDDLEALGIVVGTGLRCSAHHAPYLVPDVWQWLTERRDLHHAPGS